MENIHKLLLEAGQHAQFSTIIALDQATILNKFGHSNNFHLLERPLIASFSTESGTIMGGLLWLNSSIRAAILPRAYVAYSFCCIKQFMHKLELLSI